jgi:hypothetical protein
MLADQMRVLQVMMGRHQFIKPSHRFRGERFDHEVNQNLLFWDGGLAKSGGGGWFHCRHDKKLKPDCPAKSFTALSIKNLQPPKNAPYSSDDQDCLPSQTEFLHANCLQSFARLGERTRKPASRPEV